MSKPRNPVIARFFRWAKLAENAGFGFDKMLKWNYKVDFQSHIDFSETIFFLEEEITERKNNTENKKNTKKRGKITEENNQSNTEKVTEKVTENQKKILNYISKNHFITSKELSQKIGITPEKVRANISILKNKSIIRREGSAKGGKWIIIYNN